MTDDPVAHEKPVSDPIGLVLTAIGAGAVFGALVITLGVMALRLIQGGATNTEASATDFTVLSIAVLAGPVATVTMTMLATKVINDLWRRAVASAIAVFCAFILSGLAAPFDLIAGRAGLAVFAGALFGSTVILARRVRRMALL